MKDCLLEQSQNQISVLDEVRDKIKPVVSCKNTHERDCGFEQRGPEVASSPAGVKLSICSHIM